MADGKIGDGSPFMEPGPVPRRAMADRPDPPADVRAAKTGPTKMGSRPLFFGLRLALWYAVLFVAGAALIVYLTYALTSASLAQRDRQVIQSKLGEYASVYQQGGLQALADTVRAEQRTAPERLFVR